MPAVRPALLDVGVGGAGISIMMCQTHPNLGATTIINEFAEFYAPIVQLRHGSG